MELVKTYAGIKALKHIQFDFNDEIEFKERFGMTEQTCRNLCKYLKEKNKVVDMIETFDGRSAWRGFDFIIDNKNLSLNGFCFNTINVENFLNGLF
jgi:hypothetical protein